MTYTVTITSQGQMSIPAPIRRQLGLDKTPTASVSLDGEKIIVEPLKDIMSLRGALKSKRKFDPKKSREAFANYLATRHLGDKLT